MAEVKKEEVVVEEPAQEMQHYEQKVVDFDLIGTLQKFINQLATNRDYVITCAKIDTVQDIINYVGNEGLHVTKTVEVPVEK